MMTENTDLRRSKRCLLTRGDHIKKKKQHSISIFRFVPAVDGQWGTLINSETKEFNGMIGMVNRKVQIKIDFIWPCYFHFEIHVNFLFNWPIGII